MKKMVNVLLLSLMVVSCNGNGDTTGPSEIFQGTFALQSITATQEGATVKLTPPAVTGTLTIGPDNTYALSIDWPAAGINSETSSGTWTMNGNVITATDNDGTVTTLTVSGDQNTINLTLVEEGVTGTLTYVRI